MAKVLWLDDGIRKKSYQNNWYYRISKTITKVASDK